MTVLFSTMAAASETNALRNGGFELDADADGYADGWQADGLISRVEELPGEGHWALSLIGPTSRPAASATQRIRLPKPPPPVATLVGLVRNTPLESAQGEDPSASLHVRFYDWTGVAFGDEIAGRWRRPVGWRPWTSVLRIPAAAEAMEVSVQLAGEGQAMFDGLQLLWGSPEGFDPGNRLVDGGFEFFWADSPWTLEPGAKVLYPGHEGRALLRLSADRPGRIAARQRVGLAKLDGGQATVTLAIQSQNLTPDVPEGGLWLEVTWEDQAGRPVGAPTRVGPWASSAQWTTVRHVLAIPAEAESATVALALEHATGMMLIDGVRFTVTGRDKPSIRISSDVGAVQP